jgi:hypothetical protein
VVVALAACGASGRAGRAGAAGDGLAGADAGGQGSSGGNVGAGEDAAGGSGDAAGAGGVAGGAAGAGGVGGPDASAASATAGDANEGGAGGAAGAGAAPGRLCGAITIDAPAATVEVFDSGKSVDEDGFTGGVLASGTYWLTSVTHFGAAYTGPTREIWIIDVVAKTLEDASMTGATVTVVGYTLGNASATVLFGLPSCGATAPSNWNYIAKGGSLSINLRGSSDVRIFTKQP